MQVNREINMSILPKAESTFTASKQIASKLIEQHPQAIFCTFATTSDGKKIPYKKSGQGVARDTPPDQLYSAIEVQAMDSAPFGGYLGIVMQSPAVYNHGYFVCLDVDMKHSTSPTNIAIKRMAEWVKQHDQLTEVSVSGRGRHIFLFVSNEDIDKIKPKYKLGGGQEIEVFGLPTSAGKSVLLSGQKLAGSLNADMQDNLLALLTMWGIIEQDSANQPPEAPRLPKPEYQPTLSSPTDDYSKAAEALSYISPDCDYTTWIELGQALHTAFGAQGHGLWANWSSQGSKYKSESDIDTHWKSFHQGKGVSIGTLFHHAKDAGYSPPSKAADRKSAVEDFATFIQVTQAQVASEAVLPLETLLAPYWKELSLDLTRLHPVEYLVDGFIAHSFSVIAGQPGVGKTTAMLSVCLIVAGFRLSDSPLKTESRRKILYVTEDANQIRQSLYAYIKYWNLNPTEVSQWFIVIESKRSKVPEILLLAENVINHTINSERPLLVIDTSNSTLEIENENDNSEVGSFMAAIKQTIFTQLNTSVAIIAHTAKTATTNDDSALARGASAFTGDATLTAILFMDEDKNRFMRLVKTRYEPISREISLQTHMHNEVVTTRHGNPQAIQCITVIPYPTSESSRKQEAAARIEDNKSLRLMDKCDTAAAFVQSVINEHPEGVVIRRGSNAPKDCKLHPNAYKLDWADIYAAVPGSSKGDIKRLVGESVFKRFAPNAVNNAWNILGQGDDHAA